MVTAAPAIVKTNVSFEDGVTMNYWQPGREFHPEFPLCLMALGWLWGFKSLRVCRLQPQALVDPLFAFGWAAGKTRSEEGIAEHWGCNLWNFALAGAGRGVVATAATPRGKALQPLHESS